MKFVSNDFGNNTEILKFPDHYVNIAVTVSDTGVPVVDGKKIVKRGTIVGGATESALSNSSEAVVKKNGVGAEGVLFNDVDVTHGPASGAMLIHGFVAIGKLPEAPTAEAVTALKNVTFID